MLVHPASGRTKRSSETAKLIPFGGYKETMIKSDQKIVWRVAGGLGLRVQGVSTCWASGHNSKRSLSYLMFLYV